MNDPVSKWMSPIVATLSPDATIGDAVAMMNDKGYRNIPLVKDGKLVGSISVFDVITYLAESYPKATMNLPPNPDQVMEARRRVEWSIANCQLPIDLPFDHLPIQPFTILRKGIF